MLGTYVLIQQVESNVIIPLVMSQTVRLHPAVIAIGVVVVGQLFGFVGLFVAVPILSLLVISVEEFWVKPIEETERDRRRGGHRAPGASRGGAEGGRRGAAQTSFVIAITAPIITKTTISTCKTIQKRGNSIAPP